MKVAKENRHSAPADSQPNRKPLSRGRRWLFRGVLCLLPFLLAVLAEVCLRVGGYGYNPDFFKRLPIGGTDFFVQNEDFSFRFFPREMVRNPGPLRFPARKAAGTFRIFILGESAAMGDPAESFAPDRYLEALLREKYPERKFEVINTAVTAIDSHVILPIARECAAHDGDLWIIYMGNNEMVGPFGAATVFDRRAPPLVYARLATAIQRLRLGQCFTALGRGLVRGKSSANAWRGMEMFLGNQIPPGSPMRETVYQNFQGNLDDIVRAGVQSGATVLLNTVGVNLRDCPPFASMHGPAVVPEFEVLYTNGLQAASQQQWSAANASFAQAARLDEQWAEFQYQWAGCLLMQTNLAEARLHFQLACDYDALPFRADSRINGAIRAEPRRIGGGRLLVCDAASELAGGSPNGICGNETFFEHVHFDFDARYRLARAWAGQIQSLLPPTTNGWISQSECEQQLGLSPWNRAQVIHLMVERMQVPPLSSQANNPERRTALEARIQAELARMNRAEAGRARRSFEQLLAQRPDDFSLRENYAVFLELSGDVPEATAQWERFRDLLPQDPLGYFEAGRLLTPQQHFAEAETLLRQSLAIRPSRTDGWIELGNALAMQKKYTEALAAYTTALEQDANDPQTLLRRGKVLAHLNLHAEAMASYHAGLALNPADGLTHHELALELVAAGQTDAAGLEFREAAQLSSDNVAVRFDYATWLLRQQLWPEAQQEFEAVLKLDPGNARAREHLVWLQSKPAVGH
ncbi:MAG: tetratricopeptide repeat protein [Verrucomicrobiota bacterium]